MRLGLHWPIRRSASATIARSPIGSAAARYAPSGPAAGSGRRRYCRSRSRRHRTGSRRPAGNRPRSGRGWCCYIRRRFSRRIVTRPGGRQLGADRPGRASALSAATSPIRLAPRRLGAVFLRRHVLACRHTRGPAATSCGVPRSVASSRRASRFNPALGFRGHDSSSNTW